MTADAITAPRPGGAAASPGARDSAAAPPDTGDLAAVREAAFALLSRGVRDRRSPFHTPVFVTNGLDGFPAARTVVLRGFDPAHRRLLVHTDRRSGKVADLSADDRATLVFYDARSKVQLRVTARARLHRDDAVAMAAWRTVSPFGRRCYLGDPPGSPSSEPTSGLPVDVADGSPSPERSAAGFANFSAVALTMLTLDWLFLNAGGHRRARFAWPPDGADEQATWLAP